MYDLEIPFHRLVHHFIKRIFYGAGEGDDLQYGIPALLGLLSTPAAFGAIQLLNKYSTLLLFLTGRPAFDVYKASVPDEYFFIVYSMTITGAVVVLKWDRLFPDRQDYDNLAPLPISTRQVFGSSLIAMLFLATIFAIDINWAACLIFPWAVTSRYDTFGAYAEFFIAHSSAVILSSLFTCFALLSVLGVTLLAVPQRYLRTASLIVRIGCALLLISLLGSSFSIPRLLLSREAPAFAAFLPSVWFLDLHQFVVGRGAPFTGSAVFAIEVTAGTFVFAMAIYALTYYRQFTRIPEKTAVHSSRGHDRISFARRILDATVVRTPFQRAAYHFALKTIFRSERHCLLFGAAACMGLFIAAQSLTDALAEPWEPGLDSRLLSIPLILSYFIICSLRVLYDLPTDRNANWIFCATVDREKHASRMVGVKVMMTMVVPWLILAALPLYGAKWGWAVALFHTTYVIVCSAALAELLLFNFRKIPFTCLQVMSKDRVLVMVIVFLLGFYIFGAANAVMEIGLMEHPARLGVFAMLYAALRLGIRARERRLHPADRTLIFEDRPLPPVQVLDLR